ncbi:MAG TPA: alpha/beta hydrolase, partial [bacterium]|nr:alpha/beta hydrolase [bacterium]
VEEEHERVTAPTLLVWGDADAWFPIAQARRLQKAIRGAKLAIVKGGAHHMMEESPAAFAATVAPFLARVLRARARKTPAKTPVKHAGTARKRHRANAA